MSYGLQTIDFEKKSYPSSNECQLMIEAGHYLVDGHIIALNKNGTTSEVYALHGTVDKEDWCQGVKVSRNGVQYDKTVEMTEVI
jgi:hypothetical protein